MFYQDNIISNFNLGIILNITRPRLGRVLALPIRCSVARAHCHKVTLPLSRQPLPTYY
jgi:hypothetical protein